MKDDISTLFLSPDSILPKLRESLDILIGKEINTKIQPTDPLSIVNMAATALNITAPIVIGGLGHFCWGGFIILEYSPNYLRSAYLEASNSDRFSGAISTAYYQLAGFCTLAMCVNLALYYYSAQKVNALETSNLRIETYFRNVVEDAYLLFEKAQKAQDLQPMTKLLAHKDLHILQNYGKYGKYYEFAFTALQALYLNILIKSKTNAHAEYVFTAYAINEIFNLNPHDKMLLCLARDKMQECVNLIYSNKLNVGIPKAGARDKMIYAISQYILKHFSVWKKESVFVDNLDPVIFKLQEADKKVPHSLIETISEVYEPNSSSLATVLEMLDLIRTNDDFARLRFKDGKNWLHHLPTVDVDPELDNDMKDTVLRLIALGVNPYDLDANNNTASAYVPQKSRIAYTQILRTGIVPGFIGVDSKINIIDDAFKAVKKLASGAPNFILLSGPPGVGKTDLANIIAKNNGFSVREFSKAEPDDKFLGQLLARVLQYFTDAKKQTYPVCLFMDEFDAICPEVEGTAQNGFFNREELNTLIQTMIDKLKGTSVILVGASNFPDKIKDAVRSRVRVEILFELPALMEREMILRDSLRTYQVSDSKILPKLAAATSSWSPRKIVAFADSVKAAVDRQHRSAISSTEIVHHFKNEREKLKRSILANYHIEMEAQKLEFGSEHKFSGVAIDPNILKIFNSVMNQLRNPGIYSQIVKQGIVIKSRHLLLSGPPGTGKSTIAKDLAANINVIFIKIAGGRYKTSDKIIELGNIFEYLKRLDKAVVFIDEIDAMTKPTSPARELLQQFITDHEDRFIFIGATNNPNDMDDAILSRFELVKFPLPNFEQRLAVFVHYINNINMINFSADLREKLDLLYDNLAIESEGLSQRDIEKIISNVIHEIADRSITGNTITVDVKDFIAELQKFKGKLRLTCA